MKLVSAAIIALLLVASPALGHRLDEYLQDTTVSLDAADRISLELRLTPGVAVLPTVLAAIDTNHDGIISETEQQSYAQRVAADLSLSIDGQPLQPRLTFAAFPTMDEMKEGIGQIILVFDMTLPTGGAPQRRFAIENRHQRPIAAYLVNCLRPQDPAVRVIAQTRSEDQSLYQLDFQQPRAPPRAGAAVTARLPLWPWFVLNGGIAIAWIGYGCRRRRARIVN